MEQDTFLRSDTTYMVSTLGLAGLLFVHEQKHQSQCLCASPASWCIIIGPDHWGLEWTQFFQIEKTRVWIDEILPLDTSLKYTRAPQKVKLIKTFLTCCEKGS